MLDLLYRQGQTVPQLVERYRHYSLAMMQRIVGQSLETVKRDSLPTVWMRWPSISCGVDLVVYRTDSDG